MLCRRRRPGLMGGVMRCCAPAAAAAATPLALHVSQGGGQDTEQKEISEIF